MAEKQEISDNGKPNQQRPGTRPDYGKKSYNTGHRTTDAHAEQLWNSYPDRSLYIASMRMRDNVDEYD